MIALVQRVSRAEVHVGTRCTGVIDAGLLVFVCAQSDDTGAVCARLVDKLAKLRIFGDAAGKMNPSLLDVQGGLLLVSQFTFAADLTRGNRPSFTGAAPPELGRRCYDQVVACARAVLPQVACGEFGAPMQVSLLTSSPP